jgi:Glycosyltransferase
MLIICGKNDGNLKSSSPRVKFLGFVSEDDLGYMYNNCSAYVFPSLYEGLGLPILEALPHGTIVYTSTGGSLPEFSDKLIHFFHPGDADSLIRLLPGVTDIQAPDQTEVAEYLSLFRWHVNFRRMHRIIRLYDTNSNLCLCGDLQRSLLYSESTPIDNSPTFAE